MPTTLEPTPALREEDTIAVVAPAGPVPMERLKPALALLERHFRVLVADDIARKSGFLAGDDARRAEEFNAALRNPEVRCIWAARGGYGCSRIVSSLDDGALRADPVPIVGFSDVTVLLAWAAHHGFRSIHGPVLTQFGELEKADQEWLLDMLQGRRKDGLFADALVGATEDAPLEGRLVGGNLSLLAHLTGTPWAIDFQDSLCILEDVGERPYAIDRYLQELRLQESKTSLPSARALLMGDFKGCTEPGDAAQDALLVVRDQGRDMQLPCISGLPVGHGAQNRAFPFGAKARLEGDKLWLLESALVA